MCFPKCRTVPLNCESCLYGGEVAGAQLNTDCCPGVSPTVSLFSNPSEVELFAKKNPKQMLRRLEVFLKERRAGGIPRGTSPDPQAQQPSPSLGERGARAGTGQGSKGKEMHFTGVCDLPPDMEGEARLI